MNSSIKHAVRESKANVQHATTDAVREAFTEYREWLEWLALFLTGDEDQVAPCMADACALAATQTQVFLDWLEHWARRATILSALKMQQSRIAQLGAAYQGHPCAHREHASLAPGEIELLKARPLDLARRLDVLCRFSLVMRGIEEYSTKQSALMLGVSGASFDAAYCAALESLRMVKSETLDVLGGETPKIDRPQ
jgi:DNA-directed RNA polymerase specialized sigma24 family protein